MAEKKPLRIGLVGYGFMGRTHSNAFRKAPNFFDLEHEPVLAAVCARNRTRARKFAKQWGWESVVTDWRKLVERDDIDVIDIASPNDTHHDIAIAAAEAGKAILCEKPLSRTGKEGEAMVRAVEKAGVPNMVWYNYRRVPAVSLAKDMIDEGRVGKVYHYRANFLQDWTISEDLPQGGEGLWRLDAAAAGSGVSLLRQLPWDQLAVDMSDHAIETSHSGVPTHLLRGHTAYEIGNSPLILGSGEGDDGRFVALAADMPGVSRRHCSLTRKKGQCVLEDHSRYGTFLNGHRIDGTSVLQVGDTLRIGSPGYEFQLITTDARHE